MLFFFTAMETAIQGAKKQRKYKKSLQLVIETADGNEDDAARLETSYTNRMMRICNLTID